MCLRSTGFGRNMMTHGESGALPSESVLAICCWLFFTTHFQTGLEELLRKGDARALVGDYVQFREQG